MLRSELIQAMQAETPELGQEVAGRIVEAFFEAITDQLAAGGRVELRGFGAFSVRTYEPKMGRNPKAGVPVALPERRLPYFKPSKVINSRLTEGCSLFA